MMMMMMMMMVMVMVMVMMKRRIHAILRVKNITPFE